MKKILVLILVLSILLTACVSEKKQVEQLHADTISAILQGDAKKAAGIFSDNYIDVGDGAKKIINEEYFNNLFSTELYKQNLQGKKVEELFDLNKKEFYTYDALMKSSHKDFGKGSFEIKEGDVFAYYPNKAGAV